MDGLRCPECNKMQMQKAGKIWAKGRKKAQRWRCLSCGRTTIYPVGSKK